MPTYDYECKDEDCNFKWEKMQKMSSRPTRKCPKCKRNTAKRLIGGGCGVIFKGTGFYQTDYKNKR